MKWIAYILGAFSALNAAVALVLIYVQIFGPAYRCGETASDCAPLAWKAIPLLFIAVLSSLGSGAALENYNTNRKWRR